MADMIRKDNLTDLIHSQPAASSSGNNQPSQPQSSEGNQGKPASQVVSNNDSTVTLGQETIKTK
jgi:hypothetical protein